MSAFTLARSAPQAALAGGASAAPCDVLVVGGGINGAGIARDLAGRGLGVVLCEQDDLAQHTSSSSTKLIHGGLRYLEYYEFALVRKALAEREVLLRSAPHIMWPLRFVMPHDASMRPVWMVRAGLFLYDHLARRELLPGSRTISLRASEYGAPLQPRFRMGFVYSDGWVDDARLVVLNAMDARERGAEILTRWRCTQAQREGGGWKVRLESTAGGAVRELRSRALVNAAGPWASQFLSECAGQTDAKTLRLVKGSHIVVPRLFEHDHAYILQSPDRRIIFMIPYEGEFTLIGTTDIDHQGALGDVRVDAAEIAYLCEQVNRYLAKPVAPADVVWSYAGVRPLLEDESRDASAVTRDYQLELDRGTDEAAAPLLTVWGGKLTTFRKLAEEAGNLLQAPLDARAAWTAGSVLPGGDLAGAASAASTDVVGDFARFEAVLAQRYPHWSASLRHRCARSYGTRVARWAGADGRALGAEVAPDLFEAELNYLRDEEWARDADDVLWRRSKLGLHLDAAQRADVAAWCAQHWGEGSRRHARASQGQGSAACN
ncbi:MAG: glycerol-3-phosphate dehydrogenase [Burkholderiaceae bacterium]